ncbi:hypothetical protein M0R45_015203 [Rubus argutus]|uniref:Uncharacterized protein n=1 Tax=Rubus argutus TaxID=59490 RepID=A0AAW1XQM3_RUBAR
MAAPISSTRFPPSLPLSTITIYIPQSPSPAKPNNYTSSTAHIQSVFSCSITDHHQIRTGNQSTQPASSISVAPPSQAHAAVTVKPAIHSAAAHLTGPSHLFSPIPVLPSIHAASVTGDPIHFAEPRCQSSIQGRSDLPSPLLPSPSP